MAADKLVKRNQVCINRSGNAIPVYRTFTPDADFTPVYTEANSVEWLERDFRKNRRRGDMIGILHPNDVFAVEDHMMQTATPSQNTGGYTFQTKNAPGWSYVLLGYADAEQFWLYSTHNRVTTIGAGAAPDTPGGSPGFLWRVTPTSSVSNTDGENFKFDEAAGTVQRIEGVKMRDQFWVVGPPGSPATNVPLNGKTVNSFVWKDVAGAWSCRQVASDAPSGALTWASVETPIANNSGATWANIAWFDSQTSVSGVPFEDVLWQTPQHIGWENATLQVTLEALPTNAGYPPFTSARAGLVFRSSADDINHLWYFAADTTAKCYVLGQRNNVTAPAYDDCPYKLFIEPLVGDTLVVRFWGNNISYAVKDRAGNERASWYIEKNAVFTPGHGMSASYVNFNSFAGADNTTKIMHGIFTTDLTAHMTRFSQFIMYGSKLPLDRPITVRFDHYDYYDQASQKGAVKITWNHDGQVQTGYIASGMLSTGRDKVFTPLVTAAPTKEKLSPELPEFTVFRLRRDVPLYAPNGRDIFATSEVAFFNRKSGVLKAGTLVGLRGTQQSGDDHPDYLHIDMVKNDDTTSAIYGAWESIEGWYRTGEPTNAGINHYTGGFIPVGLEHGSSPTQINFVLDQGRIFREPVEN